MKDSQYNVKLNSVCELELCNFGHLGYYYYYYQFCFIYYFIGDNNLHLNILARIKVSDSENNSNNQFDIKVDDFIHSNNIIKFVDFVQNIINSHVYHLTQKLRGYTLI